MKYIRKLARWILRKELNDLYESCDNTENRLSSLYREYATLSYKSEKAYNDYNSKINTLKADIENLKKENEIYERHFSLDAMPSKDVIEETKIDIRIHKLTLENEKLKQELFDARNEIYRFNQFKNTNCQQLPMYAYSQIPTYTCSTL